MIGQRFGKLVVESFAGSDRRGSLWSCKCDCGGSRIVDTGTLNRKDVKKSARSCGCTRNTFKKYNESIAKQMESKLLNKRFGKLVVVEKTEEKSGSGFKWLCKCDCGNFKKIASQELRRTNRKGTQSCGCVFHKQSFTRLYRIWGQMREPICNEWSDFHRFKADMGDRPTPKHCLARIDTSLPFSKENCRWMDVCEMKKFSKVVIEVEYQGEKITSSVLDKKLGFSKGTIIARIRRGWSIHNAIHTPLKIKRPKRVKHDLPNSDIDFSYPHNQINDDVF